MTDKKPESAFTKKYKAPAKYRAILEAVAALIVALSAGGLSIQDIIEKLPIG